MGRRAKQLTIVHPEGQHYACRDCPARCCTSWGIPVSPEERERVLADEEAAERLDARSEAILQAGVLPMRERQGSLACVFLDDDLLCSLHKRHGHEFLPTPCQAFPFGFSENERKQPVALLSRYCPSIRDDYGDPVEPILRDKLELIGGTLPMSEKMGLRSGRVLPRAQYARVIERWRSLLEGAPPADALARIYDFTDSLDVHLPRAKHPNDKELRLALERAEQEEIVPLAPGRMRLGGRILIALLLGALSYPTRVLLAQRTTPIGLGEKVRSWMNRLSWLLGIGRVRLQFVDAPVRVARVERVERFLRGKLGVLVSDYLREVLVRRQGMQKQTYLSRIISDLALMTTVISRYARAAASAEGCQSVQERHVKEGIGIAELLFTHQTDAGQSYVLHQLRFNLMSDRKDFRRLLASEV